MLDYDLDIYKLLADNSKQIYQDCEHDQDLDGCVQEKLDILNLDSETEPLGITWSTDCDSKSEKIFYEVLGFLKACLESIDNNCLCKYNFSKEEGEISEYNLKGQYPFKDELFLNAISLFS